MELSAVRLVSLPSAAFWNRSTECTSIHNLVASLPVYLQIMTGVTHQRLDHLHLSSSIFLDCKNILTSVYSEDDGTTECHTYYVLLINLAVAIADGLSMQCRFFEADEQYLLVLLSLSSCYSKCHTHTNSNCDSNRDAHSDSKRDAHGDSDQQGGEVASSERFILSCDENDRTSVDNRECGLAAHDAHHDSHCDFQRLAAFKMHRLSISREEIMSKRALNLLSISSFGMADKISLEALDLRNNEELERQCDRGKGGYEREEQGEEEGQDGRQEKGLRGGQEGGPEAGQEKGYKGRAFQKAYCLYVRSSVRHSLGDMNGAVEACEGALFLLRGEVQEGGGPQLAGPEGVTGTVASPPNCSNSRVAEGRGREAGGREREAGGREREKDSDTVSLTADCILLLGKRTRSSLFKAMHLA